MGFGLFKKKDKAKELEISDAPPREGKPSLHGSPALAFRRPDTPTSPTSPSLAQLPLPLDLTSHGSSSNPAGADTGLSLMDDILSSFDSMIVAPAPVPTAQPVSKSADRAPVADSSLSQLHDNPDFISPQQIARFLSSSNSKPSSAAKPAVDSFSSDRTDPSHQAPTRSASLKRDGSSSAGRNYAPQRSGSSTPGAPSDTLRRGAPAESLALAQSDSMGRHRPGGSDSISRQPSHNTLPKRAGPAAAASSQVRSPPASPKPAYAAAASPKPASQVPAQFNRRARLEAEKQVSRHGPHRSESDESDSDDLRRIVRANPLHGRSQSQSSADPSRSRHGDSGRPSHTLDRVRREDSRERPSRSLPDSKARSIDEWVKSQSQSQTRAKSSPRSFSPEHLSLHRAQSSSSLSRQHPPRMISISRPASSQDSDGDSDDGSQSEESVSNDLVMKQSPLGTDTDEDEDIDVPLIYKLAKSQQQRIHQADHSGPSQPSSPTHSRPNSPLPKVSASVSVSAPVSRSASPAPHVRPGKPTPLYPGMPAVPAMHPNGAPIDANQMAQYFATYYEHAQAMLAQGIMVPPIPPIQKGLLPAGDVSAVAPVQTKSSKSSKGDGEPSSKKSKKKKSSSHDNQDDSSSLEKEAKSKSKKSKDKKDKKSKSSKKDKSPKKEKSSKSKEQALGSETEQPADSAVATPTDDAEESAVEPMSATVAETESIPATEIAAADD
ncbi:uncharacterized protein BJ171DRAFT_477286 [Polychytrium aggregatum]|uniref:uncharacterized protein n=1 Tax=Polychytrium aggregatum TaxID=110093 RepID=UPI0022FF0DDF|nr:uncharacterized protein BJ171DRAFT_477286 [Polychytrium aggregatum]KAI9199848.1 hypothetical protein BJ171DRAFT_477286 [Polychytrium aggregatum]